MKDMKFTFLGFKKNLCYAISIACFAFFGCSGGVLQNEIEVNDAIMAKSSTRGIASGDIITVGDKQYEIIENVGVIVTIGCVVATTASHMTIKISYPTISPTGGLMYKEYDKFYDYAFVGTNIYDWSNSISPIVEDQLDIEDKVCASVNDSDTYLYLDITTNDGPYVWGGKSECIWIRYYLTHEDYTYRYLKLENSAEDPQHYKARLAIPFNNDIAAGYIYFGDARISDSYGVWGPKHLGY